MSKVAVVFWSQTGNTEAMAGKIVEGASAAGAEVTLYQAADFNADLAAEFDAVALGCPAMGAEELEDSEFAPMYEDVKGALAGKKVGLFGSYGWGDGEWMRIWVDDAKAAGLSLVQDEGLIVNETPDADGEAACEELGRLLA